MSLCFFILSPAFAQPAPKLDSVSREWIQRGTTVEVTFTGTNLAAVSRFVFDGEPGLSATNVPPAEPPKPSITVESSGGGISRVEAAPSRDEKRLVAKITATSDAPLGMREVRVVTPTGISNPLTINVGHLPEAREKAPNNSLEQAQSIDLPAAINGSIAAAAETDYYRFKASKDQELVFEVDAARRGSQLDSSVVLLDKSGAELARNEDYSGLDSLLTYVAPEDGEYILQIRDFRYQGGGNYGYRLYAGAIPYVESVFPLGGQRGKEVEISIKGRNLDGTSKMTLALAENAARGRQEIRLMTPKGYSNLLPFDVSEYADFTESETNNSAEAANQVTVPVVINGRIGAAKDVDRFKFKSDKDQKLVCDVQSYRFGSPLDALLVLEDAKGAVLQQNDDTAAADARIEFDAKKDTEYVLALRDLTSRGGGRFAYRLSIRPPSASEASFTARFTPDAPRVSRGGHTRVRCEIIRSGGFDGPVRLAFENLPTGVVSEPLVIPAAPSSGLILITATRDAVLGTFPIKLMASGMVGGKEVTRVAEALDGDKPVRQAYCTVLDTAPYTLELITLAADIEQNQAARIEVLAQRRGGFTGDIKLTAEGFSAAAKDPITKSFDIREATLKGGETTTNVKLTAKQDSEVGTRTVVIRGESTLDGAPVIQYSRPVPITVTEIPYVISSTLSRLPVTALPTNVQSAASEAATIIKLARRAGFTNEVLLSIEGLPAGVLSTLEKIPANGTETGLKLVATEKAAPGTNTLTVVGTGLHNDRNYKHRTGQINLVISAPEPAETAPPPPAAATATATTAPVGTK